ncbi:unnamed protein product [Blepharisma stoltei]|uniref:Uncharacterized protein n=1 Tax=Blepharisma stoltei TaxID=1481888 RepID=A0AAU9JUH4_9CILI|nr:unnamed protein product [Blepharisma stoltei]
MSQLPPQRNIGRFMPPVLSQSRSQLRFNQPNSIRIATSQTSSFLQNPFSQCTNDFSNRPFQQDETTSLYSESTLMAPPNQMGENLGTFKSELCEFFKLLAETHQKNAVQVAEAWTNNKRAEIVQGKEEFKKLAEEAEEKIKVVVSEVVKKEIIDDMKDNIKIAKQNMKIFKSNFQRDIKKIHEKLELMGNRKRAFKKETAKVNCKI